MKNLINAISLILALLCLSAALLSCKGENDATDTVTDTGVVNGEMPKYDTGRISSYIKPFEYKGLTVYARAGETRQEALWNDIVSRVEIIEYPAEQVEYYVSQERAKYRYLAGRDGVEYEALLSALGVSEESMYESARALVCEDLALQYIINDANITLSDEEIALHTDKYAEKLSEIYGYDAEYIKTSMAEQMRELMLSDKTMEFLLSVNTVDTQQSK